jgi:hypothetical protein
MTSENLCGICKRPLDDPNDPTTLSCGGDCLKCMAEVVEDPDCVVGMLHIQIEALTAEVERLRADLRAIAAIPRSDAAYGLISVIARTALAAIAAAKGA